MTNTTGCSSSSSSSKSSSGSGSGSSKSSSRSSSGGKRRTRRMRGGKGASEWQMQNVGTTNQQWDNVFIKGGPFGAAVQNLAGTQPSVVAGAFPGTSNLTLIQRGGSRRRRRRGGAPSSSSNSLNGGRRSKKGGYWGKVLSQALVPFSLLFAQNRFGTRKHRK